MPENRKIAMRRLRYAHMEEHRELYLEERGPSGRNEGETWADYSKRLSRAYSKATYKLKNRYADEYADIYNKVKYK